jgi:uncharacterized protein YjbI with pentapeptide repeats
MANQEQLDILKQGVEAWNQWREESPGVHIDLSKANLKSADLHSADLFGADLCGADLSGAFLCGANLISANLKSARLVGANLMDALLSGSTLSGADLSGAYLGRAFLRDADLVDTNLTGVTLFKAVLVDAALTGASLMGTNLTSANLTGVNLSTAKLGGSDFSKANLSGASLVGTTLISTDLSGSNLSGANLSGANIGNISFGNVDLSDAKGLETVQHFAPSTIGIDTIYLSHGKIPEVFLKRAGVPDTLIEYMRSLVDNPIDYYSCFISYSSNDDVFARRLYADLQSNHVRCWFAPEDLKWGERIRVGIDDAIRAHDKLLLILSKSSVASGWVEREVRAAMDREQKENRTVLFPVRVDRAVFESPFDWATEIRRERNIGDFTCWKDHDEYQKAFARLLRDLQAKEQLHR